jgi:hypothetical protein
LAKAALSRMSGVHARIKGGRSDCEEPVRRKILWDNAQKLYKVAGPSAADEAKLAAN